MQWKRSQDFCAHARHCEEIARMMSTLEGRREFEKLARGWLRMAEHAEQEERQREANSRVQQAYSERRASNRPTAKVSRA